MSAHCLRHALLGGVFTLGTTVLAASHAHAQASPSPYTSATRYDVLGRVTGTIAPDPDGASPWQFLAVRNTFDNWGRLTKIETGSLSVWKPESVTPLNWGADFTAHTTVDRTYDNLGHKLSEAIKGSDGVTVSLTQFKYLPSGELECTAVRMNPATFASPPTSACTLGTEGSNGPDRITRNEYLPGEPGVITKFQKGYGTPLVQDYASYTYSASLKVISMTDARGFKARMSYDGHDRQNRWHFPDKLLAVTPSTTDYEEYGYDANGNRTSLRKRDGSTLTYSYDALNRMTLKVVPSRADLTAAQTRDVYFDYDLRGLMTKARFDSLNGEGITSTYSGFGELASSTITMSGLSAVMGMGYDLNSKRTRLTHADGQNFTYVRDQLGRVSNIYEGTTQTLTYQLIQAAYDNRGLVDQVQRATTGNAFLADFTFDPVGRLSSLAQDATGTVNDLTISQTFNSSGQIATQTRSNDAYSWTGSVNVDRNYTVNGINQYQAAGSASFCHDANGNLTADGASVYKYDIENRLVEKRAQVGSACPVTDYTGTSQAGLVYDPMGRLFQVTGPTTNTRFLYDGDELVAAYDAGGTLGQRYVHSDNVDDPVVQYNSASVGAGARIFLMPDERGSIAGLFDNNGNSLVKNTYDEYGIPGSANQGRFAYTGQAWIPELGMYYYKARIYSPTLGRFLQTDPIGYADQVNLYAYVGNDPINLADPSGECGTRDKDGNCLVTMLPGSGEREKEAARALQAQLNVLDKKINALKDSGTTSFVDSDGNKQTISNADYKEAWNSQNWSIGTKEAVEAANGGSNGGLGGTTPGQSNLMADSVFQWGNGVATHVGGTFNIGVDMLIQHEMAHTFGPGLDAALANPVMNGRWNLVAETTANRQGAAQTQQVGGSWICRFAPSGCR